MSAPNPNDMPTETKQTGVESEARSIPTTKLAALSHFTSLGRTLSRSSSKKEKVAFPPPSWTLDNTKNDGAGASDWSYNPERWTREIEQLKQAAEGAESGSVKDAATMKSPSVETDPKEWDNPPGPKTIANRIWTLIHGSESVPAHSSTANVDQKLANLLSSEAVMNGETKGNSVWSILERLGPKRSQIVEKEGEGKEAPEAGEGIMVYAPLQPARESEVELADSDMVLEYMDDPLHSQAENSDKGPGDKTPEPTEAPTAKAHREWHPSPTKLSLQVAWWGYRLYLPPPVLAILSDTHLAAAKRGAMITAALKWLLDKVPMMLIPPPFRPAAMMLKRLTPYLGYVGGFVAWSWERIKKRDKGDGVVLTATWLLPLALIPATWDPKIHGHPKPPLEKPVEAGSSERLPDDKKTELDRQKTTKAKR